MPPFFLSLLAMFSASIVSPAALAQGKDYVEAPRGRHRRVHVRVVGEGGDHARREPLVVGRPPEDRQARLRRGSRPAHAYLRLENGQVDGIDNVATRDVGRIRGDARFTLHEVNPGLSVCYLSMNNDVKPFDDVRVRRAVALAIDKARIVDAAYENLATPIATLVPASIPYSAPIKDRVRDVAAAKKLLKEAGAEGARVRLQFPSNPRPYLPNPDSLAAQIRDDLRDIGLEVELKKEEWSGYLKLMQNGEHQMGVLGWIARRGRRRQLPLRPPLKEGAVKGSANNVSFYRSDAFQAAVSKARSSYDPEERRRLYAEAQQIAFDDVPLVPLIVQPRTAATSARVKGFVLDPISSPRFARCSLSR